MTQYGMKESRKKEPDYSPLIVNTDEILNSLKNDLKSCKRISINTFTYKGPSLFKPLLGIGITSEKENYYIPFTYKEICKKDKSNQPCQGLLFGDFEETSTGQGLLFEEPEEVSTKGLKNEYILDELKPFIEDPFLEKVGFDLKKLYINLASYNIKPAGLKFDVCLAAFLLDSEKANPSLSHITSRYLSVAIPDWEEILGKGKKAISPEDLSLENLAKCSARVTYFSNSLVDTLEKELEKVELSDLFYNMEMPIVSVLARMQMRGISLDKDILKKLSLQAEEELKKSSERIYSLAGDNFNINSPKQLGEILFKKLELPGAKKTKTGYSTASDVLEPLREDYEIVGLVLDYRELNKLKTTYLDVLPGLIDPVTGKLHTHFNQMVTSTGRLSSSEPNLQNIPCKNGIRKACKKSI